MAARNMLGDLNLEATQEIVAGAVQAMQTATAALAALIQNTPPDIGVNSLNVRLGPQALTRTTFAGAVASGLDAGLWNVLQTGAGQTVSQSGGNALINAGTTANAEFLARSQVSAQGCFTLRERTTLSQRIANNNFIVELVDVIGDALPVTILSATSINITVPDPAVVAGATVFSAANIGQSINVNCVGNIAGAIPGRYVISAVNGLVLTLTVAGWPASGTGTCSLTGMNYHRIIYTGTTATATAFGCAAAGYGAADTSVTMNTTAGGHIVAYNQDDGVINVADQLTTSATTLALTKRGSAADNIPTASKVLYVQIRALNGTVAPASNTLWTLGFVSLEDYTPQQVNITGIKPQGANSSLPVTIVGSDPTTSGSLNVMGALGHGSTWSTTYKPVLAGYVGYTANPTAISSGMGVQGIATLVGAQITKPYSIPEGDWSYAAAAGGLTNTTATPMKAAAGAGIRNYLTSLTLQNANATATEVLILDGVTTIARFYLGASTSPDCVVDITFPNPLKSTANAALNIQCVTTGAQIYANAQGYIAP